MRRTLSSLVAGLAVGCTWVGQGAFEEVLDNLDEDKDGTPFKTDCDDQDPSRGNIDEVPYDAVDNDCSLDPDVSLDPADVDVDGDTFPGISREDYEAAAKGLKSPLSYPSGFDGKPIDCDDNDPLVKPADDDTNEVWYDGIDQNCDRANDFDSDRDGYVATFDDAGTPIPDTAVQAFADRYSITTQEIDGWGPGGSGGPSPGDCEDTFEEFFPGATNLEVPYSGLDEDCDGQDEYDQDNDGFLAPDTLTAWRRYQTRYHLESPEKPDTDCADGPDVPDVQGVAYLPKLDLVLAATVHPGAVDEPYDGVDADCGEDDDFDADGDEYIRTADLGERDAMIAAWGYEDVDWAEQPGGDCDDDNGAHHPGVLDVLFNGEDEDCDGLVDLSYLNFGDGPNTASVELCGDITDNGGSGSICWTGPSNPEILYFDEEFSIYGSAQEFTAPGSNQFEHLAGAVLRFERESAIGGAEPLDVDGRSWLRVFVAGSTQVLSNQIDLTVDTTPAGRPCTTAMGAGNDCHYIVLGAEESPGGNGEIHSAVIHLSSGNYLALPRTVGTMPGPLVSLDTDATSLEIGAEDVGVFVQCGADGLHGKFSNAVGAFVDTTLSGDTCFFYSAPDLGPQPLVELCDSGVCSIYEFDGTSFLPYPSIDASGDAWVWGDREFDVTLTIDTAGDAWVRPDPTSLTAPPPAGRHVFLGRSMLNFDIQVDNGLWYLVGVTDTREVLLEIVDPLDPNPLNVQRATLVDDDLSNPTWEATGVAVAVADGKIAVAVTHEDLAGAPPRAGNLGWTFLGVP
jgi:hypothetical protein